MKKERGVSTNNNVKEQRWGYFNPFAIIIIIIIFALYLITDA